MIYVIPESRDQPTREKRRRENYLLYYLMQITVKLFATLQRYGPEEQLIRVSDGTTVADLITLLSIPEPMAALRIVNGVHVPKDHPLHEGDVLSLFPPIAGGIR